MFNIIKKHKSEILKLLKHSNIFSKAKRILFKLVFNKLDRARTMGYRLNSKELASIFSRIAILLEQKVYLEWINYQQVSQKMKFLSLRKMLKNRYEFKFNMSSN